MKDGFIKVAAASPLIKVADCKYNCDKIIEIMKECNEKKVKLLVLPELCITGASCGDLYLQDMLIKEATSALVQLVDESEGSDMICMAGLPFERCGRLYNVAAVYQDGELLGLIPKKNISDYSETSEHRYFEEGPEETTEVPVKGLDYTVPFGTKLLFECEEIPELIIGAELSTDVTVPVSPSCEHALAGAVIIANLSAANEFTGRYDQRRELIKNQSARLIAGYVYANAGEGESTTDYVYEAQNIIAEKGSIIAEAERFTNEIVISEIDYKKLLNERRRVRTFKMTNPDEAGYETVSFEMNCKKTTLTRNIDKMPFIPADVTEREKRCNEIFMLQSLGLKKRMEHACCKNAVIGISGGLDSTLALLVTVKAFDMLGIDRSNIMAITLPCFGTTDRTYNNALTLIKELGASFDEINIKDAVKKHFEDIGHDESVHDVTYENSQARERTQILMDVANKLNAMVIGTGDMSELALGWATYNGDHMSMYGVNASIPKTLVRYLVTYYAEVCESKKLKEVLEDILDTPVSPELLPPSSGEISQKTEDIVGPYELHDFFLYYVMRFGYMPSKIYRLALYAFDGVYDKETIQKWLHTFYRRFFTQQFKRSCLPDGPAVGSVGLSPRGGLRMPSDAVSRIWLDDLSLI